MLESLIKKRRSCRKFRDGHIAQEKLEKMVELALWAPNSCNRQAVHFRFVRAVEHIQAVAPAAFNQPILSEPITLAVVCVDTDRYRNTTLENNLAPYLDAGTAIQNFLLAATELGIGSCVIAGRLDEGLIKDVLNLPGHWIVPACIALGICDEEQLPPERDPVRIHMSFDNEAVRSSETSYEAYISLRRRWARAGFDVARYYHHPKEGLPVYHHALMEMERLLTENEHWLVTATLMGEFVFDEKNVDHLVASADERWFLTEFLSREINLIQCSPLETDTAVPERTYDRIVSPFDVHFLGGEDLRAFAGNAARWLKPDGTLTVIFFNRRSFWSCNYALARLLKRDVGRFRFFGYETPLSFRDAVNGFHGSFYHADRRTISFLPPPNLGYTMGRMRLLPLHFVRSFDPLGVVPLFRGFGNVAIVNLRLRISQ